MSRILLPIAPKAQIVPVLCSAPGGSYQRELGTTIAKSFAYAQEIKADVVSSSWGEWFNKDEAIQSAAASGRAPSRLLLRSGVLWPEENWFC